MRNRSKNAVQKPDTQEDAAKPVLFAQEKPMKTLILPFNASPHARFILMENPRMSRLSRYFYCPVLGVYEFTAVGPSSTPKSILLTASLQADGNTHRQKCADKEYQDNSGLSDAQAFVSRTAQLLIATPVDLLFFLLPILSPIRNSKVRERKLFQPLDDILDSQESISRTLKAVLIGPLRPKVEARMKAICDIIEAGETMYRINETKLIHELLQKARNVAKNGLPTSMEERFVSRELQPPIMSVSRNDESVIRGQMDPSTSTSQTVPSNGASKTSAVSHDSTLATDAIINECSPNESIRDLLRIRIAFNFILCSYVRKDLATKCEEILRSPESPLNFDSLDKHIQHLIELRARAMASRSTIDFVRKRGLNEDDGALIAQEKKKHKKIEDEKIAKATQARGVRELKKADTSGMKKLSSFFAKVPAEKKS